MTRILAFWEDKRYMTDDILSQVRTVGIMGVVILIGLALMG